MKYEKMNNLFLRQSYLDSWEDYERSKFDVNRCFFSFLSNEVRPVYSVKHS